MLWLNKELSIPNSYCRAFLFLFCRKNVNVIVNCMTKISHDFAVVLFSHKFVPL